MQSVFLKYIIDNWPSFAIVIIVAVSAGYLVRKFTKWEDSHLHLHESSDKKYLENENEHKNIMDISNRVLKRIEQLERFLIKNGGADYNEFTQMNSPRQLSPKGRRLYEDSGALSFFDQKKDAILRILSTEIDRLKTKTALDVELCATRICSEISGNDEFKPVKDFIYTHPVYEGSNISINTIAMLMGIELRNEYLKLHPEIEPVSEQMV